MKMEVREEIKGRNVLNGNGDDGDRYGLRMGPGKASGASAREEGRHGRADLARQAGGTLPVTMYPRHRQSNNRQMHRDGRS